MLEVRPRPLEEDDSRFLPQTRISTSPFLAQIDENCMLGLL